MSGSNRQALMWVLLVLLIGALFVVPNIGTVEVALWFVLLAAWVAVFFTWARRGPKVKA